VNPFDVRIYRMRRRIDRHRPFEVRWCVAGQQKSKSFTSRGLADSYRAELVRAARKGLEFDPATGEPVRWAVPEPVTTTWYQHAVAYADMKWPHLAAHSRASMADALATLTPVLTKTTARRPPAALLRKALYAHALNPQHRASPPDAATASALAWLERASLPLTRLQDPQVTRRALDALTLRLDGSRAAANTITRKRAVFYNALGYAVELGLLAVNPVDRIQWKAPKACGAVDPRIVASPTQVRAILGQVARTHPEVVAFFGCLYYAALRPEEATDLRRSCCTLPARGWGLLTLTTASPRTAAAWTGNGTAHERRGLKHRPDGAIRLVPIPPHLVRLLRRHLADHGTAPDGRLFRGARGGPLSESCYGRTWHTARAAALGPALAATALARRPYDLRHAALSLWLNAGAAPAEIAARAGHSVAVLLKVYAHCIQGQDDIASRLIDQAFHASPGTRPGTMSHLVTASGPLNRRSCPDDVRYASARGPHSAPAAHLTGSRPPRPGTRPCQVAAHFSRSQRRQRSRLRQHKPTILATDRPDLAHTWPTEHRERSANRCLSHIRPGTGRSSSTGPDLGLLL